MSGKYDSFLNSFAAYDMYNLPMPALPPADLSIAAGVIISTYVSYRTGIAQRVVDFSPRDNPYLRAIGLTSNLADGLVDASSAHNGSANAWHVVTRPIRFGADLTGTIANTAGSAAIVGTGTLFTRETAPGMLIAWIDANAVQRQAVILAVTDDTNIVLTAVTSSTGMRTANTVAAKANPLTGQSGYAGSSLTMTMLQMNVMYPMSFFLADARLIFSPRGKITTVAGSAAVTGVGTKFLTDMVQNGGNGAGYVIGWTDDLGVRRTGVVASIASETALTLTAVVVATGGGTNVPMLDLDNSLRILMEMPSAFAAYTIAIDPAFGNGTRRLSLSVLAEIEHTFGMDGSL